MIFSATAPVLLSMRWKLMADKIRSSLINRVKQFLMNKKNRSILILLVGSGLLVGSALNYALGFPVFDSQGILGAIAAITIVYSMS